MSLDPTDHTDPEFGGSSSDDEDQTSDASYEADGEIARPEPPVTGDAAIDDAVARLADAAGAPLEQQLPVLEAVHRTLQDRLADVEG